MHRSGKGGPKTPSRLIASTVKAGQNRNRVTRKIKVLLADGHALVRSGFRRIIEDEVDLTVIGETGDGVRVVQMARELRPRVVLMDYSLPQIDGLRAAEQIVKTCPRTAVLMVSMRADDNQMRSAIRAGARGYVAKTAGDMELVSGIRRVAAGELVFPSDFTIEPGRNSKQDPQLSARESEVLQLIVDGNSNREIASQLDLSANTVATHRVNIMKVLRIHKTADLVVYAIRKGLASIP
jgi:DNA-binding NarL/FixJ family response regulator